MIKGQLPGEGDGPVWVRSRPRPRPLDPATKQIVGMLQRDGRRPFAEIAEAIGIEEAEVASRVERLVEAGVLVFTAVTDPLELGFARQAMLGLRVAEEHLPDVVATLKQVEEIYYIVRTAGGFELLLEVIGHSDAHLLELVASRIKPIPGVLAVHTFLYLELVKQAYDWGVYE